MMNFENRHVSYLAGAMVAVFAMPFVLGQSATPASGVPVPPPGSTAATPSAQGGSGTTTAGGTANRASGLTTVTYTSFLPVDCIPGTQQVCPPGSNTSTVAPPASTFPTAPAPADAVANWNTTTNPTIPLLSLPKYIPNPAFCERVIQVDVTARAIMRGSLAVENRDPLNGCLPNIQLNINVTVAPIGIPGLAPLVIPNTFGSPVPLAPFDGTVDFAGPSGTSQTFPPLSLSACKRFIAPAEIATFVDSTPGNPSDDFIFADHAANASSSFNPCAPITFLSDPFARVEFEVTYTVCRLSPPVLNNDTVAACLGATPIDVCVFANDTSDTQLVCPTAGTSTGITNIPAGWTAAWAAGTCTGNTNTCSGIVMRITPPVGFTGTAPGIRYTLGDADGCSDFADVVVTVRTPPVLNNDTGAGCQGSPIDVCVFANDTTDTQLSCPAPGSSTGISNIPAGWTATWVTLGSCAEGALTCTDLAMRITPPASFTGVLSPGIRYTLSDVDTCSDFADVAITVRTPPVLNNDTGAGCQGSAIDVCVFANDTTDTQLTCPAPGTSTGISNVPAGWTATWVTLGSCAEGALTCTDLAMRITPPASFTGVLSPGIRYTLSDVETCSDFADVAITVRTPPVLADDTGAGCQGSPIDVCVFANDTTDTQLNCPAPGSSTGISNIPAGWTASWVTLASCTEGALTCTDLAMRITPPASFTGASPAIRYTLTDADGCSDFADVVVTVRTPPVLNNDTGAGCQGSPIDVCVFANDTTDTQLVCPPAGTSTGISNIPAGWTASWVTLASCTEGALTCTDLAMRITPPASFTGVSPTIRYTLTDSDTCTDFADVTVTVRTPPVLNDDTGAGCQGSPIDVCVFANDTTDTQLSCPAPGSSTGISNIPAGWTASWVTLASCTEGALTCTDLALRITPPASFTGTSPAIRYTLSDVDTCTDFADVVVTVRTPPVLADDTGAGCQGAPIDVCVFANDTTDTQINCPAPGSSTGISNIPAGWTASWVTLASCAEGALTCTDLAMRITPPASFTGASPAIRYTLSDTDTCSDFADVVVTVRTPPVLNNDTGAACQGSVIDVCVFANDTTDTQLNCPAPGSSTGISNIPAGWTATWVTLASCSEGALTCTDLAMRITPPASFTGVLSPGIRYTLTDTDTCTDFADVSVTVRTPPVLNNDTGAGCQGSPIDVCVFANDTTDTQLTCPAPGSSTGISNVPAGWTASWVTLASCTEGALTCTDLAMRITAPASFTGVSPAIRYTLTDTETCTDFADVTVTVRTPPVLVDDAGIGCPASPIDVCVFANDTTDTQLNCPAPGSSTGISNVPAGWTASWVTLGSCAEGALTCTDIAMRITPPASFTGVLSPGIRYTLSDTETCSDFADVAVTVRTPPVALNDSASTCNGQPVLINILANDSSDSRLQCANITVSDPPHGTAVVVDDASCVNTLCTGKCVRYTPDAAFSGADSFTYTIRDTDGCTATATVTTNNCRTNGVDDAVSLCVGDSITVDVLFNDSTTCGSLRCPPVIGAIPPNITVESVNCGGPSCSSCRLRITAVSLPAGPPPFVVSFTYTIANDAAPSCSDSATVTVTINPRPVLPSLPPITRPNGSVTPIVIDILTGGDPGAGCEFDLSSIQITQHPLQGTVSIDSVHGQLIYTPFASFAGTDRICYSILNTCGCPATGCVDIREEQPCPTTNRLECGSLLLFPEFDNTASSRTLVTITDGCCTGGAGNVRVEVIFINRANCLETNRTYTLTPCDTLSFVTSFAGPANARGYLYAFAKSATPSTNNPNGTPIVYNHLIGQEVVIDGITNFDYAINAVSFKGFGAEGEFNDDDGDGIRDLNGLPDLAGSEYERAPDRILIPRFLGQDPVGGGASAFKSDIVLINLSGGSQFTTVVDITVFNDNEEAFSAQHQFVCWDKLPLATFSSWTLQSSLLGTGHARGEINGFNRESGWMILNGNSASSASETILDPAIYAVLIERAGGYHAADLPFELCLQDNGDLLPRTLFGDGPNPQAGDNQ